MSSGSIQNSGAVQHTQLAQSQTVESRSSSSPATRQRAATDSALRGSHISLSRSSSPKVAEQRAGVERRVVEIRVTPDTKLGALRNVFHNVISDVKTSRVANFFTGVRAQMGTQFYREVLGDPIDGGGILDQAVPNKSGKNLTVEGLMAQYLEDIGSDVTVAEMRMYVNMGERMMTALTKADPSTNFGKDGLTVLDSDDFPRPIKSNLETTRAISWFLQAKGIMDNASTDRDPVLMGQGSMRIKDPGGKLFRFLDSAPNSYGRKSTHFNERAADGSATGKGHFLKSGLLSLLAGGFAQRGIEDFDRKMPSGQGCILFGQLKGGETFCKWEDAGVPTMLGGGRRAANDAGLVGEVKARALSPYRCLKHCLNFGATRHADNSNNPLDRREHVYKGPAKDIYDQLLGTEDAPGGLLDAVASDLGLTDEDKSVVAKDAKKHGLDFVEQHISKWKSDAGRLSATTQQALTDIDTLIDDFKTAAGADMGMSRRGAEVHVSLPDAYQSDSSGEFPDSNDVNDVWPSWLSHEAV